MNFKYEDLKEYTTRYFANEISLLDYIKSVIHNFNSQYNTY